MVADGDHVDAGDVLVKLDPTTNSADRDRIARDLVQAQLDISRLRAVVLGDAQAFAAPADADPVPRGRRTAATGGPADAAPSESRRARAADRRQNGGPGSGEGNR